MEIILGLMFIALGGVIFIPFFFGLLLIIMGIFAEGGFIDLSKIRSKK